MCHKVLGTFLTEISGQKKIKNIFNTSQINVATMLKPVNLNAMQISLLVFL